ncbi:MAG: tRNA (adenosine(37)-N6)-threonylcarbamoyltransferase complex dimerization subunit type 1 TsaB, partial [Acidimicrobiia bacterium]
MSKVLAIETATPASSVALADGREIVASAARVDRRGHSAFLVPAIDFCFDQAGWRPEDIDAVVVDVGPGLYTGIRVGIAT